MQFYGTSTGRRQGTSIWTPQALATLQQQLNPNVFKSDPTHYEPVYTRKGLLQLTTDVMWLASGVGDVYRLRVLVHASVVSGPGRSITPGQAARMIEVLEEDMEVPATTSRADQKQFLETMCEIVAVRKERPYRLVNPITTREPQKPPTVDTVFMDELVMDEVMKGAAVSTNFADIEKRVATYCAADVDLTKNLFTGATTWHSKT